MKRLKQHSRTVLFCLYVLAAATACKEEEEVFTQFPAPIWSVNSAEYQVNMTAVVRIPDELLSYVQEDDQLAAFAGEVCRGTGALIDGLYYVTILGMPDDQSNIRFSYYSARNKYMYQTGELFAFETDKVFGTVDSAEVLQLSIVK
jgi:hypothetical protein